MSRFLIVLVLSFFGQFSIISLAQDTIRFDTTNWILDKNASIETYMGKQVLRGTALLKDVQMDSGTIEIDVYST